MSLIIIEGVDRTGKTTLAERLAGKLREDQTHEVRLLHFGPPEKGALQEYLEPLLGYDPRCDHVVCDRFHLGEQVWPQFFDREPRITDSERGLIELFLHSRGALVVHATRDVLSLRRALKDDDEPLDEELAFEALKRFEEVVGECACTVFKYDYKYIDEHLEQIAKTALLTSVIASRECTETGGIA